MEDFVAKRFDVFLVQGLGACDVFVAGGILGDEGALANQMTIVVQVFVPTELIHLAEKKTARNPYQGILDPAGRS